MTKTEMIAPEVNEPNFVDMSITLDTKLCVGTTINSNIMFNRTIFAICTNSPVGILPYLILPSGQNITANNKTICTKYPSALPSETPAILYDSGRVFISRKLAPTVIVHMSRDMNIGRNVFFCA